MKIAIEDIIKRINSKYKATVIIALDAERLNKIRRETNFMSEVETPEEKTIVQAMRRFIEGKIQYKFIEDEQDTKK